MFQTERRWNYYNINASVFYYFFTLYFYHNTHILLFIRKVLFSKSARFKIKIKTKTILGGFLKKIIYITIGFFLSCSLLICLLTFFFLPILSTNSLIFPYAITPFDICKTYPDIWKLLKLLYFICFFLSYLIIYSYIAINILKHKPHKKISNNLDLNIFDISKVHLKIGETENHTICYIGEKRIISKYLSYWNYWKWKNFLCNVSIYKTINFIF